MDIYKIHVICMLSFYMFCSLAVPPAIIADKDESDAGTETVILSSSQRGVNAAINQLKNNNIEQAVKSLDTAAALANDSGDVEGLIKIAALYSHLAKTEIAAAVLRCAKNFAIANGQAGIRNFIDNLKSQWGSNNTVQNVIVALNSTNASATNSTSTSNMFDSSNLTWSAAPGSHATSSYSAYQQAAVQLDIAISSLVNAGPDKDIIAKIGISVFAVEMAPVLPADPKMRELALKSKAGSSNPDIGEAVKYEEDSPFTGLVKERICAKVVDGEVYEVVRKNIEYAIQPDMSMNPVSYFEEYKTPEGEIAKTVAKVRIEYKAGQENSYIEKIDAKAGNAGGIDRTLRVIQNGAETARAMTTLDEYLNEKSASSPVTEKDTAAMEALKIYNADDRAAKAAGGGAEGVAEADPEKYKAAMAVLAKKCEGMGNTRKDKTAKFFEQKQKEAEMKKGDEVENIDKRKPTDKESLKGANP